MEAAGAGRRELGFNEAGAFLPRKPPGTVSSHAPAAGFNEAGAFLPRKRLVG